MEQRTMTGALALIKVNGVTIGKMKNISVTETFQRGDVKGLGELISQEKPVLGINCSLQCGFYTIDLKTTGLPQGIKRDGDVNALVNNLLLQDEKGVDIYIYRKTAVARDENGNVTEVGDKDFAVIRGAFLTSQSFDLTEMQISGTNQQFEYLVPILFPNVGSV